MGDEQSDGGTAPNNPAPFACNVCGRSYSRVDHLARHYRSHTNERPFACDTCGKHFSRADLLRRHAAAHVSEPANKKRKRGSSLPAHRVSLACTACSAAKVKCDEGKPCHRCLQKGFACEPPTASHGFPIPPIPNQQTATERFDTARRSSPAKSSEIQQHEQSFSASSLGLFSMAPGERRDKNLTANRSMHSSSLGGQNTNGMDQLSSSAIPTADMGPMVGDTAWLDHESALGSFLADVMMPLDSPLNFEASTASNGVPERNVLDFGTEQGFDFDDFDFSLFSSAPPLPQPSSQQPPLDESSYPPSRGDEGQAPAVDIMASEAFQRSLWRWIPNQMDRGQCEQLNLSLPSDVGVTFTHAERPCSERLEQSARDKIMAMVMSTCDQNEIQQIVSQFPSADALDCLAQDFLFLHQTRAVSYIHVPTFHPNVMRSELVAMTAACGAVRNSVSTVRKLGFALQESVRLTLPKSWERDNSLTRDLQMLQSNLMWLDVGLWSGNKRKMEISESHLLPLVTMLRRAGRFKKARAAAVAPTSSDSADVLNMKWREWVDNESFKRLVFATIIHDAQVSMSFFVPPLITYAELSLDLPACEELWRARSAQAWRQIFLSRTGSSDRPLPKLGHCLQNVHSILEVSEQIDIAFARHIFLSMFWRQIWDCRQLAASTKSPGGTNHSPGLSLASSHWQQDLSQALHHFRMTIYEHGPLSPPAAVAYEHLLLNICVSFEELSRFAGKEGMREARLAFPLLKQWVRSREARQAVWHAGQILREARMFSTGALRNFSAIALYHAGLTLWAFGFLSNRLNQPDQKIDAHPTAAAEAYGSANKRPELAVLDGGDSTQVQKFIALNKATPALRYSNKTAQAEPADQTEANEYVFFDSPKDVMKIVIGILQSNHGPGNGKGASPLVENLVKLMQDLSHAASKITRRSAT